MADLRDRAREISPRAQGPRTPPPTCSAALPPKRWTAPPRSASRPPRPRPSQAQRQAADQAEQGARHAEDLGRRPCEPTARQACADPATDGLAAAQAAVRAAGQHLSQARAPARPRPRPRKRRGQRPPRCTRPRRACAQSIDPLAGHARTRGSGSHPSDPRGTLADQGGPDLAGLKAAVRAKTGRTWGELPGHLRTEILQMSQGRYRDDYARLIELYFREIAADAADRGARP